MIRPRIPRFRDLPLLARLLIPFLALMLFAGGFGVVVIVRDLSQRGQAALEQDLSRRLLEARSALRDRELYLVESANFAANVEGIAARLQHEDSAGVTRLVRSVLALKADLDLLAITDTSGRGLVEFVRPNTDGTLKMEAGRRWERDAFVSSALTGTRAAKSSGFITAGARTYLAIAAPICPAGSPCHPAGVAIVGIDVQELADSALAADAAREPARGATLLDEQGLSIATSGTGDDRRLPLLSSGRVMQRTRTVDGIELSTAYADYQVQGRRVGTIAVTIPTAPAFASARGAGARFALVLVAVMLGIVALGAFLSRSILAQVKPLVATNRALGQGDLSARAVVLGAGELGELARGVNQMAEQLQAMYANLELRVEQRTEEVRRLLRERTEFFASISHELRTPLAAILGQGTMMLDPKYPKNQRWATSSGRMIVETANQLITVVNEILDLARAESGRLEMTLENLDIGAVLKELAPTFKALARRAQVHFSIAQPIDVALVRADRRRLQHVLLNLVDNAVKYTPAGGSVTVSAVADQDAIAVSVADTGVGIPAEAGDLIFEPFYRVKGAAAQGGQASSGLGLALCKRLVEAQGGAMSFASVLDEGSTFTFRLPRATATRRERPGRSERVGA